MRTGEKKGTGWSEERLPGSNLAHLLTVTVTSHQSVPHGHSPGDGLLVVLV